MLKSGANHVNCFIGTVEGLSVSNRRLPVAGENAWNAVRCFPVVRLLTGLCIHQFLGAFAQLREATISFVISVRLRGTTLLLLDGFS